MFKVNDKETRTTPGVSHLVLMSTLNMYLPAGTLPASHFCRLSIYKDYSTQLAKNIQELLTAQMKEPKPFHVGSNVHLSL